MVEMDLLALQIIFVASLSVVTVTSALVPIFWLWLKSSRGRHSEAGAAGASGSDDVLAANPKVQKVLSGANAFSCGVFVAMVVMSLLPGTIC